MISWERFCKTVAKAQALARPEEFDAFEKIAEHQSAIQRWSPGFLSAKLRIALTSRATATSGDLNCHRTKSFPHDQGHFPEQLGRFR